MYVVHFLHTYHELGNLGVSPWLNVVFALLASNAVYETDPKYQ
jgi:hypothetical protein